MAHRDRAERVGQDIQSSDNSQSELLDKCVIKRLATHKDLQREMCRAMLLCHNCIAQKIDSDFQLRYQGSSPDEVAILKGIRSLGAEFLGDAHPCRSFETVFEGGGSVEKVFDVEFTSKRAMQTSVFFDRAAQLYVVYTKGADNRVVSVLADQDKAQLQLAQQRNSEFSRLGFRTIHYAFKYVSKKDFEPVVSGYRSIAIGEQKEVEELCRESVERDERYLGFVVLHDEL